MGLLSNIARHVEFQHLLMSPEDTAVEEQTLREGSLNDDMKEGFEEERVGLSLMKCMGYEEDARRCILMLGSGSTLELELVNACGIWRLIKRQK
jgi:hypothetical protein